MMIYKKIFRICIIFFIINNDVFSQSYVPEFNNEKVKIKPIEDIQVFAFSIKDVRLLDSPFKKAMERDANYLLSLDADRFLHRHRVNAGLEPKAEIYGGWEELGVSGFSLGHYISALAMYFAATGEEKFQSRVNYIVDELALMQKLRKHGYVGGIPEEDRIWSEIRSGNIRAEAFDLNGGWVPFYTVHKLMAGLVDAYLYAENDIALDVVVKMSDWLYDLTKALSEEQMAEIMVCEFGGLNDVLATVYAITGNKKYIDLSYRFNHKLITEPLARKEDHLNGIHANTQIPKLIGSAVQYGLTGDLSSYNAASFFWETVIDNHTYVIGGNSDHEMFGEPGKLSNRISYNTTETCNTYNMMKLTRHLFAYNPTSKFTDYYERALYNHILASQNPEDGMMCYYVPLKMGGFKKYNTPFHSFWCCTGTGMENHVKYGENIYARGKDGSLFVNLFIPSELDWKERGVKILQETNYPDSDHIRLSITTTKNQFFPLRIRQPKWAKNGVQIKINGKIESVSDVIEGYIVINRNWKNNDLIEINIPMSLYTENMPDNKNRISLLYGPLVLAATFEKQSFQLEQDPTVLIGDNQKILDNIVPIQGTSVAFKTIGIAQPSDVTLLPFYNVHNQYYNIYWDLFSQEEWVENRAKYIEEKNRMVKLEEVTLDQVRVGEQQPEVDHNFEGFNTNTGNFEGKKWRESKNGGWFSYEMKVVPKNENILLINLWDDNDQTRNFDLLIDNVETESSKEIKNKIMNSTSIYFQIPEQLIQAKNSVSIKIYSNTYSGKVFELLTLKRIIEF